MSILNFVTQDQLDNLDEDPRTAFMELVNHAQRSLDEQVKKLDPDEQREWHQIEDLRYSFMNVVIAAAKRYEIDPFVSMDVPQYSNYGNSEWRQFTADIDHYLTQLMLDNSIKSKKNSVAMLATSKDRIRGHLHALRNCIEKSHMPDEKRRILLDKLDVFEKELEKRRVSLMAVTLLAFEVISIPGSLWATGEVAKKLIATVMQVVADDKSKEDEIRQLPATQTPKALLPPRAEKKPTRKAPNLDDEIPF
jgi:hypothetical protein